MRHLSRLLAGLALLAAGAVGAEVRATDDTGAEIVLAQPARRIVSLSPHLSEQLFAIGAGSRIVATTDFADYPDAARTLPRVARAHSVDLERVAAARPDLIVVWSSGFPPATLAALHRLGVPLYVDEPSRLDGIAASMLRLGALTAAPGAAGAAAQFRASIGQLRDRYASRAEVSIFYQVWAQPLMTQFKGEARHDFLGRLVAARAGDGLRSHRNPAFGDRSLRAFEFVDRHMGSSLDDLKDSLPYSGRLSILRCGWGPLPAFEKPGSGRHRL